MLVRELLQEPECQRVLVMSGRLRRRPPWPWRPQAGGAGRGERRPRSACRAPATGAMSGPSCTSGQPFSLTTRPTPPSAPAGQRHLRARPNGPDRPQRVRWIPLAARCLAAEMGAWLQFQRPPWHAVREPRCGSGLMSGSSRTGANISTPPPARRAPRSRPCTGRHGLAWRAARPAG